MNKLGILLLTTAAAAALIVGCSDETGTTSDASSSAASSGAGGEGGSGNNFGDMPSYGTQVDRFGRPAINTALNNAFNGNAEQKDQAKDAWNADSKSAEWASSNKAEVAKNLAIIDSLDAECGNQLLAGDNPVAGRYDTLATLLGDDRLWLNTGAAACQVYLAVEAGVATDCGGRAMYYDVIDTSYSALAIGGLAGVTDGIGLPTYVNGEIFPYLAEPL